SRFRAGARAAGRDRAAVLGRGLDEVSAAFARSVPRSAVLAATAFSSRAGTDPDGSGGPFGFDRTGAVEPGRGAGLSAIRRAAGANTSAAENITTTGDTGRDAGGATVTLGMERAAAFDPHGDRHGLH